MTNQEAIQNAYGEYWKQVKDYVDGNGWCDSYNALFLYNDSLNDLFEQSKPFRNGMSTPKFWIRPKSLKGIENNNQWIKIESESDLPKDNEDCWFIEKQNNTFIGYYNNIYKEFRSNNFHWNYKEITHYQPITKPLNPLY